MHRPDTRPHASLGSRVENLRRYRTRPEYDASIGAAIAQQADHAERVKTRLGASGQVWAELVPADLALRTAIEAIRRGELVVVVADAATRYQLDLALRSGLRDQLLEASRGAIRSVRLRIGSVAAESNGRD